MEASHRAQLLAETFVALADTLVVGYDIVDLLQTLVDRCTEILDSADADIMLASDSGDLEVVASSSECVRRIEHSQIGVGDGPGLAAYRSGRAISIADISESAHRWPLYSRDAREAGYATVHAVPMRLRKETIGALSLFRTTAGPMAPDDAAAAQALADAATIGIIHERAFREADLTRQQLQRALDSRVIIEQAKGLLAHAHDVDVDAAFHILREHARMTNQRLHDVAISVVERRLRI